MKKMNKNNKRCVSNYKLLDGGRIVYYGVTNNIDRRLNEHKSSGKKFTACKYTAKRTRKSALQKEKDDIEKYQRSHNGRFPKYNKRR